MTLSIQAPPAELEIKPRLVVIGVGGAGGNAVNNMIDAGLTSIDFVVANTDAQAMRHSKAERKIQLGATLTKGLGAGGNPEIGAQAARESIEEIRDQIMGANMVFIAAGMGGGTGTGAASIVAEIAKEEGILTVGVVTKPFIFEGAKRRRAAEDGIEKLQQLIDTLIIVPNHNLFRVANHQTTLTEAFRMADEVLLTGVRAITDLMIMPGLINLDFADVRTVMLEMGRAMMGTGEAEGEDRAIRAAEAAISNPLLENSSLKGARSLLVSISGGPDFGLMELNEAAERIREEVGDDDANIILGSSMNDNLAGKVRVTVIATGIDTEREQVKPVSEVSNAQASADSLLLSKTAPTQRSVPLKPSVIETKLAEAKPLEQNPLEWSSNYKRGESVFKTDAEEMEMEKERAQPLHAEKISQDLFARPLAPSRSSVNVEDNHQAPKEQPQIRNIPSRADSFIAPEPVMVEKKDAKKSWISGLSNPFGGNSTESTLRNTIDREIPEISKSAPSNDAFLNRLVNKEQAPASFANPLSQKKHLEMGEFDEPNMEMQTAQSNRNLAKPQTMENLKPNLDDIEDHVEEDGVDETFLSIPAFLRRQVS